MSWLNPEHYYDSTVGAAIDHMEGKPEPLLVIGEDGQPESGWPEGLPRASPSRRNRHWNVTNWEDFANGIIINAAEDYRAAMKTLRKHPGDPDARERIREVEEFMLSSWFSQLTRLEGRKLLKRLKEEFD